MHARHNTHRRYIFSHIIHVRIAYSPQITEEGAMLLHLRYLVQPRVCITIRHRTDRRGAMEKLAPELIIFPHQHPRDGAHQRDRAGGAKKRRHVRRFSFYIDTSLHPMTPNFPNKGDSLQYFLIYTTLQQQYKRRVICGRTLL